MIKLSLNSSIKLINKSFSSKFSSNAWLNVYNFKVLPTSGNKLELFQSPVPKSILNLDSNIIQDWKFGLSHVQTVIKGKVYGWGNNDYGQVGPVNTSFSTGLNVDDNDEFIETPFLCPSLEQLETKQVASGYYHNYSLTEDGSLMSWGAGILGRGSEVYDPNPQKVTFFEEIQTKINKIYATGNYSLASVSPLQNPDRQLIYGWGYLPSLTANPNYKAIHPILIKPPNFSSQNEIKVSTQENGFWISTKEPNSIKWDLHWFGKSSPESTLERPYYPTYDEASDAITSLSWSPELELSINIDTLDKVHLIENTIVTKNESDELIFFNSATKSQLEGMKISKVKDWGYLGSNLFVVFSLENELQLYSIDGKELSLVDEKLILSRVGAVECQHGQVLLK